MIASLNGKIISKNPPELILAVDNGISYEMLCPMSSFYKFNNGEKTHTIYTHLSIKDDSHTLFGFATIDEKKMFRGLIKVNGVGPKVALAILSYLNVDDLVRCIHNEDDNLLAKTPGIGKKTAQKIIIELKDKVEKLTFGAHDIKNSNLSKAKEALNTLGFKTKEADKMLNGLDTNLSTEELIRLALQQK